MENNLTLSEQANLYYLDNSIDFLNKEKRKNDSKFNKATTDELATYSTESIFELVIRINLGKE